MGKLRTKASQDERRLSVFAQRIRQTRLEQGLTLRKLADIAKVSPGTIHKIEAGRLMPSLAVFGKIITPLNRGVSYFFGYDDESTDVRLVRANEAKSIRAARLCVISNVARPLGEPRLEANLIKIAPGGNTGRPISTRGELLLFVKKGIIDITVRNKTEVLHEGDTLHMKGALPHRFENKYQEPAELFAVISRFQ